MSLLKSSILFFLLISFIPGAYAQQVTFNDLNLVDRDISIYAVNESGTYLISPEGSNTANLSINLSQDYVYQVVIEPSKNTWFDDPRNALTYFVSETPGQTLTFLVFACIFGGIVRIVFR